ncbi:MAG TPA: CPBP family intramembrane glutamic endopeptidase [Candidatus Acidoferrales bacterium]|nr:CPBP family intramembrane glutamic endopeptidase [Candidatus Acidoferrales bacterium]
MAMPPQATQSAPPPNGSVGIEDRITNVFVSREGIRAGWRCLIFAAIFFVVLTIAAVPILVVYMKQNPGIIPKTLPFTAPYMLAEEAATVIGLIAAALLMSKIESRPPGQYGLPLREAFGRRFWEGVIWGFVAIAVVLLLIAAFHGLSFGKITLSGATLVSYAVLWGLAFLLTGFSEEFLFRGYSQFTLTQGMGFWPAAILLSLLFGALHLSNAGEGWAGALSAATIGFFFCFTLRRTGTIWFAVGLHAAWDYAETFVFGVPNSGLVAPGQLLHSAFHGPQWLTGGTVGPEASAVCFVVMGLLFLAFHFAYPPQPADSRRA